MALKPKKTAKKLEPISQKAGKYQLKNDTPNNFS